MSDSDELEAVGRGSSKQGVTIIEVIFAVTIFSIIVVVVMGMMNRGLFAVLSAADRGGARDELSAQADALRFIHDGWAAERENAAVTWQFNALWSEITRSDRVLASAEGLGNPADCNPNAAPPPQAFVLNTRRLIIGPYGVGGIPTWAAIRDEVVIRPNNVPWTTPPPLHPRIIYTIPGVADDSEAAIQEAQEFDRVAMVEGVWVVAVRSTHSVPGSGGQAEFFDFHIRTCWNPAGQSTPDNASTIVRLYNPGVWE
ncbi:prepilin-type N-terminal cleavage/methylation domain-containing protein [Candidatus Saccharibacteria bacterium]|nr:prepilin-type N-terminal cleavage/methylation domain-containing protein [Candidatus Saccharibacteria bacterium]